ncbi:hypothetical protein NB311A_16714 [Nitrobacter sp. Nb-311A]|uniref:hypothetical protein n=1 Tax=unclassified Nitrobacter TaxID=2620411 RepID=UPI0000685E40|nr:MULTISPECIES: hypothetical protein [unclassified Nitrobacter]EAQ35154.1 hypothetical protein NB311A_16714 [Nitrobacter sp. Nb-311A]MCB1393920.1 hypothetical protein [Nitrobacter sp.]MCV0386607.1 hypothetical protein [Nitrobacter sp.]
MSRAVAIDLKCSAKPEPAELGVTDRELFVESFPRGTESATSKTSCAYAGMMTPGAFPLLIESEAGLSDFDLARFLYANRYPLHKNALAVAMPVASRT